MGIIRPGNSVKQVLRQSACLCFSLRDKEFRVQELTRDATSCRKVDILVPEHDRAAKFTESVQHNSTGSREVSPN